MKKIFSALFITLFGAAAFMTSCSDVPAPYDIKLPGDVELVGDGTKENPYNVATAAMKQDGSTAWVQGYIVGVMETNVDPFSPSFTAPFSTNSNLMIADTPEEQSKKNCLMVQLPVGDIRTALNLVDHAENRTKPVMLEGKLTAYFGEAGLKEVSAGVFNGEDIGDGGGETPEGNIIFEEKFDGTKGNFTIHDVTLPTGSDHVWKADKYQDKPGYMKASAFVNSTNYAAESWLISPEVDLSTCKTAYLTFMHAHKFSVDKTKEMTVWTTEAGKEEWKQVTIPTYASGDNWTLVSAGKIDLNAYVGKKMQFMFKYVSTTEGAPTWEVNNVQVIGDGDGGGEIPTPGEEVEVTTDKPYEEKFETGLGAFSIKDKNIGGLTFVWKHDAQYKYMKASAFKDGAQATESWLVSPILNLTSLSKAVLTFEQAVNHSKGKATDYLTLIAAEAGTENWETVTITYPESDSWNFVPSGEIDLTKYAGKKIQLAFKYTSSTEIAATWEIKNVKVSAGNDEPIDPPTPEDKYTSNIGLQDGEILESAYIEKALLSGLEYEILKVGKSKSGGSWTSAPLKASSNTLSFYGVAWKGSPTNLTISIENGGTFEDGNTSKTIELTPNDGATGTAPYETPGISLSDNDYKTLTLKNITESSKINFSTIDSKGRALLIGIQVK